VSFLAKALRKEILNMDLNKIGSFLVIGTYRHIIKINMPWFNIIFYFQDFSLKLHFAQ